MRGVVISGGTRRCGHERPVADQFLHPLPPVYRDAQLGRLRPRAQQGHLIDRKRG